MAACDACVNLRADHGGDLRHGDPRADARQAARRLRRRLVRRAARRRGAQGRARRATRPRRSRRRSSCSLARPDVRAAMGEAAAGSRGREHDVDRVAEGYAAALELAAGGGGSREAVLGDGGDAAAARRHRAGFARGARARRAGSPRSSLVVDRARAVPAWAWLAGIVLVSFLIRAWLARSMVAPFIMVDELIYAELAQLRRERRVPRPRRPDERLRRRLPDPDRPRARSSSAVPDAYAAVKTINSLVMSLAAVPGLPAGAAGGRHAAGARRRGARASRAVAGLHGHGDDRERLLPGLLRARAGAALRSSSRRWLTASVAARGRVATRAQAVACCPRSRRRRSCSRVRGRPYRARLRPFLGLYASLAVGRLAVVAVQAARGRSLVDLVGAYGRRRRRLPARRARRLPALAPGRARPLPGRACPSRRRCSCSRPFAVSRRRCRPSSRRPALSACLALTVAAFASQFAYRIQERNLFVIAPLFLIGLLAWIERGAPATAALAGRGRGRRRGAAPGDDPVRALHRHARPSRTRWRCCRSGTPRSTCRSAARSSGRSRPAGLRAARSSCSCPAGRLRSPSPSRSSGSSASRTPRGLERPHGFVWASRGALFQGIRGVERDWIDEAVAGDTRGGGGLDRPDRPLHRQPERVLQPRRRDVYYVGAPDAGRLRGDVSSRIPSAARAVRRRAVRERRDVLDGTFDPLGDRWRGTRARDDALAARRAARGVEPRSPGSTRGHVVGPRRHLPQGAVPAGHARRHARQRPALFTEPTTVVATQAGREVGRIELEPDAGRTDLRVPPSAGREACAGCASRSRRPRSRAGSCPGSLDDRRLGAHFYGFVVDR